MIEFETYVKQNINKIYRLYKYKRVYTPYEIDKKFSDESIFENGDYATMVKIVDMYKLPDNDLYIKFKIVDDDLDTEMYLYEKLSDIKLEEYTKDNE